MAGKRKAPKSVSFGGRWTDAKLGVLAKYLRAYTTALKNQPFEKLYIDAFAGTGYREPARDTEGAQGVLLPELAAPETQGLLEGSASLALSVAPRFDKYVFIEKSRARCKELEALKASFPTLAPHIKIVEGDANEVILGLCSADWSSQRAVLFLDPFGMQVEWRTVEAIARTQAIDLWYLFPLVMGVVRLLDPSGDIPPTWKNRLDRTLPADWAQKLYRKVPEPMLFDVDVKPVRASTTAIADYLVDHLRAIFAKVAKPAELKNSMNSPLYLLCFAASNARGAPVAVRIANHLLEKL